MSEFRMGDTAHASEETATRLAELAQEEETVEVSDKPIRALKPKSRAALLYMIKHGAEGKKALHLTELRRAAGYKNNSSAATALRHLDKEGVIKRQSAGSGLAFYEVREPYLSIYKEKAGEAVTTRRIEIPAINGVPEEIREAVENHDPRLKERDIKVFSMTYGLFPYTRPHSSGELAAEFGKSRSWGIWALNAARHKLGLKAPVESPKPVEGPAAPEKPKSSSTVKFHLEIEGDDLTELASILAGWKQ